MRIRGSTLLLLLSVVLAIAAGVTLYVYASGLEKTKAVAVLKRPVEAGTPITRDMLQIERVPVRAVPDDAVAGWSEIKDTAARGWMPPGTILRRSHLVPIEQAESPIEAVLSNGMVAMTVPLQIQSGGALPSPGDRIMVYGLWNDQGGNITVTRIGDRIRVLERIGPPPLTTPEEPEQQQQTQTTQASAGGIMGGGGSNQQQNQKQEVKPETVVILVLEVSTEQAEAIARHVVGGRLFALLPSAADQQKSGQTPSQPAQALPPALPASGQGGGSTATGGQEGAQPASPQESAPGEASAADGESQGGQ